MAGFESTLTSIEVKKELKSLCTDRFNRFSQPCKHCPYRWFDGTGNKFAQTCIFDNCPIDWDISAE